MPNVFILVAKGPKFRLYTKEWGNPEYYELLHLKISGPKFIQNCCLEFPVFEKRFIDFGESEAFVFLFIFAVAATNFHQRWFFFFRVFVLVTATLKFQDSHH